MTKVMGIVNVTPDSFSDGGKFFTTEEAVRRVRNVVAEGADIIDIGGESTRPGATAIGWEEEWRRIEPVLAAILPASVPVSVDTYHPETAERAVAAGAAIVNCVRDEPVPAMLRILEANDKVELVLPAESFLADDFPDAMRPRCYADPMIGFGTTREEDVALMRGIPELARRGRVLIGASRKRIVKKLVGEKTLGKDLAGSLAVAVWCAAAGASVVRVHDVRETVQAMRVVAALEGDGASCINTEE